MTTRFAQFRPSGEIVAVGSTQESVIRAMPDLIGVSDDVTPDTHYVANGAAVKMPSRPSPDHKFDYASKTWVDLTPGQKTEKALQQVAASRRAAYPAIGDQLDMLWHAMDSGAAAKIEPFYSEIKAVKEAHPKPQ